MNSQAFAIPIHVFCNLRSPLHGSDFLMEKLMSLYFHFVFRLQPAIVKELKRRGLPAYDCSKDARGGLLQVAL